MKDLKDLIPLGKYRHFKGNEYEVIALARHSETGEAMVVYRALYGDGDVWVRPANMWNETVCRDGKTYKRFYRLDRIERVERYERLYEDVLKELAGKHESSDSHISFEEKVRLLENYYSSGEWLEDYTADENGEFPPDMKRGVLSQDGLFDLLERVGEEESSG